MLSAELRNYWLWLLFLGWFFFLVLTDFFFIRRKSLETESGLAWRICIYWLVGAAGVAVAMGLLFDLDRGLEWTACYLLEKCLSVDNLFVFIVIFEQLRIPANLQERALTWGLISAVFLRTVLLVLGLDLVRDLEWITPMLGVILLLSGIRLLVKEVYANWPGGSLGQPRQPIDLASQITEKTKGFFGALPELEGQNFLIRNPTGLRWTPSRLLLALVAIEIADLIFAMDSLPAILAFTTSPFIAITSNIMAVMGLRALYFALASSLAQLRYLSLTLAAILAFVGLKMILALWIKIPILLALLILAGLLTLGIVASRLHLDNKPVGKLP